MAKISRPGRSEVLGACSAAIATGRPARRAVRPDAKTPAGPAWARPACVLGACQLFQCSATIFAAIDSHCA